MNELMIPPTVKEDPDAFEILRLWAANGEQHITIHSNLNGDASDFGFLLAQLAQHGANLYSEKFNIPIQESLNQILNGFNDEIEESPDDNISGEIMK